MTPDSTTVGQIIGVDPASPFGVLLYPFVVTILTTVVALLRRAASWIVLKNPAVALRIWPHLLGVGVAATNAGTLNPTVAMVGVLIGFAATGIWDQIIQPILRKAKLIRGQEAPLAILLFAGLLAFSTPSSARADSIMHVTAPGDSSAPGNLSLDRLSGGVRLGGVIYQNDDTGVRAPGFEVEPWLSWGLTDVLSIAAAYGVNFADEKTKARVGLRQCLNPENQTWQLFIGSDLVHYDGNGFDGVAHRESWTVLGRGSWSAVKSGDATKIYLVLGVDYDVNNRSKTAQMAFSYQGFGGHSNR